MPKEIASSIERMACACLTLEAEPKKSKKRATLGHAAPMLQFRTPAEGVVHPIPSQAYTPFPPTPLNTLSLSMSACVCVCVCVHVCVCVFCGGGVEAGVASVSQSKVL